ncbi:MAG: 30S ribosomal protein THX [Bacteroidetes bacterium]|nr:30S ribosomal protein THX [Bacteroidota bacterium]
MGKGDQKTAKGKRIRGSYGVRRPRKNTTKPPLVSQSQPKPEKPVTEKPKKQPESSEINVAVKVPKTQDKPEPKKTETKPKTPKAAAKSKTEKPDGENKPAEESIT